MSQTTYHSQKNINRTMRILTGIAIILVVLGHLDCKLLTFGIFPYYSFHVMIFVFASGYFYKTESEKNIGAYLLRKIKHLLLPYFIWNLVYGLVSTGLSYAGFTWCGRITLFNLFVEPFLGGHQYGLNFPAWFVPALFLVELCNIFGRRLLFFFKDERKQDLFLLGVTVIAGILTVYFSKTGHVWGYWKTPGRILLMLPVFEFGRVYHQVIEKHDKKIPDIPYLCVVLVSQLIVFLLAEGSLNFSVVWCTGFAGSIFLPYFTSLTGILFWLRISRILEQFSIGRMLELVGAKSFDVMMHHITVFFLISLLWMAVGKVITIAPNFDMAEFHTNINYVYLLGNHEIWKLLYAICGVSLPVLVGQIPLFKRRID